MRNKAVTASASDHPLFSYSSSSSSSSSPPSMCELIADFTVFSEQRTACVLQDTTRLPVGSGSCLACVWERKNETGKRIHKKKGGKTRGRDWKANWMGMFRAEVSVIFFKDWTVRGTGNWISFNLLRFITILFFPPIWLLNLLYCFQRWFYTILSHFPLLLLPLKIPSPFLDPTGRMVLWGSPSVSSQTSRLTEIPKVLFVPLKSISSVSHLPHTSGREHSPPLCILNSWNQSSKGSRPARWKWFLASEPLSPASKTFNQIPATWENVWSSSQCTPTTPTTTPTIFRLR